MKTYECEIVLFKNDLTPFRVLAEGSRTKVVDAINEILRTNENIHNISIQIMEKK